MKNVAIRPFVGVIEGIYWSKMHIYEDSLIIVLVVALQVREKNNAKKLTDTYAKKEYSEGMKRLLASPMGKGTIGK